MLQLDVAGQPAAWETIQRRRPQLQRLIAESLAPFRAPPMRLEIRSQDVLSEQHVASLGAQLFARHLVAVQVAGTLLLAALVGAVAIASQGGRRDPLTTGGSP